jgi:amino acid adenylation domain-containing protein
MISNNFHDADVEQNIITRFQYMVKKYPNNIAINEGKKEITYSELDQRSSLLSNVILENASDESPWVCLLFDQDIELITAMLATAKAGKGWVSLDSSMPSTRLSHIMTDAAASIIICESSLIEAAKMASDDQKIIDINSVTHSPETIGMPMLDGHAFACLLYTSGSSGQPKGVIHSHRNLLHVVRKSTNSFSITASDHIAMISPIGHVVGLAAAMIALMNGGTLMPFKLSQSGFVDFAQWLDQKKIAYFHVVPTVYRRLLLATTANASYEKLRVIAIGGEKVTEDDIKTLPKKFPRQVQLRNAYGCTEAVDACQKIYSFDDQSIPNSVSIGQAAANFEEVRLSKTGERFEANMAQGESGEIVVGSDYLALGYWHNEKKTDEKFFIDESSGKRFYCTGDLGVFNGDNDLVYIGRADNQVKINGYRIELEEIETKIHEIEGVSEAAVISNPNNESIVAFYCQHYPQDTLDLKGQLSRVLPAYMMPSEVVRIDVLPQLHNGKVDRVRLVEIASGKKNYAFTNHWVKHKTSTLKANTAQSIVVFKAHNSCMTIPKVQGLTYREISSIDALEHHTADTYLYAPRHVFLAKNDHNDVHNRVEVEAFFAFIKKLITIRGNQKTTLIVPFLSTGQEDNQYVNLIQSAITGICKSLPRETPKITCRVVGLDSVSFEDAKVWQKELYGYQNSEDFTAYRNRQAYVQRLRKTPKNSAKKALEIKADGIYLISGGMGELGLYFAQYLADSGAKHIILIGRSTPKNDVLSRISKMEQLGCRVDIQTCDIADATKISAITASTKKLKTPLLGVIHAAGAYDFNLLQNKSWGSFDRVLSAKIDGAWNLHRETLDIDLDFFVLISSVTSVLGFVGHSDYCAANSYLNALSVYRNAINRPSVSLNYGTLAGGMANSNDIQQLMEQEGVGVLSLSSALSEFIDAVQRNHAVGVSINANWERIYNVQHNIGKGAYFSDLVDVERVSNQADINKVNPHQVSVTDLHLIMTKIWCDVLKKTDITVDDNFFDAGGDSLGLVSVHLHLSATLAIDISVASLLEYPTIASLAKFLHTKNIGNESNSSVITISTAENLPPLFMINSTGIARSLDAHLQSTFAIHSVNMFRLSLQFQDHLDQPVIQKLANTMANDLSAFQSTGPIKLMGFCQDGLLTVEVANELIKIGRTVDFIGLFDVTFGDRSVLTLRQRIQVLSELGLRYMTSKNFGKLSRVVRQIYHNFRYRYQADVNLEEQKIAFDTIFYDKYLDEAFSREPEIIDVNLNLMISREWKFKNVTVTRNITSKELIVSNFNNDHMGFFSKSNIHNTASAIVKLMTKS